MPPTPGLGEVLFIVLLVAVVFFGERAGALGDALGRFRERMRGGGTAGTSPTQPPSPEGERGEEK